MARDFPGSGSNYLIYNAASITAYPLTMACWYNADVITSGFLISLSDYAGGGTGPFFAMRFTSSRVNATVYNGSTTGNVAATTNSATGTWQHAAAVFTSANAQAAFLNGGNKGTADLNRTPTGISNTVIGASVRSSGVVEQVNGRIAEVGLWNVALSDAEVAILAKGVSPLAVRPSGLVCYWPIIGKHSPEVEYVSGFSATVTGTVPVAVHPRVFYPGLLAPPRVSVGDVTVQLTWTDNSADEDGFSIERSSDGINFAEIDTVAADAVSYNDSSGLAAASTYYYRMRAFRGSVYSDYSPVAEVTTA